MPEPIMQKQEFFEQEMLEENATVIEVIGERVLVETMPRSSCSACASSSCSTSVIAKLFSLKRNQFLLDNTLNVKAGQIIVIGISDDVLVKASLWAYLFPLLGLIGFTALGASYGWSAGLQAVSGLLGLLGGFWIANVMTTACGQRESYTPVMLRHQATQQVTLNLNLTEMKEGENE